MIKILLRIRGRRFVTLAMAGMAFAFSSAESADRFSARLTDPNIPAGAPTTLQLIFKDCEPDALPTIPEIEGLHISYIGPSRNSKPAFSPGQQRASTTLIHQFSVTSSTVGLYEIPPISASIGGILYQTRTIRLNVSRGINYDRYAFLNLHPGKTNLFEGEKMEFTVELYEVNARVEERPKIQSAGFVLESAGKPTQQQRRKGNQTYNVISFRYIAQPAKSGPLELGPVDWNIALYFRSRQGLPGRDAYDSLFPSRFKSAQTLRREVTLHAEAVPIRVAPLPTKDRPAAFTGAVGSFTMSASVSPTNLMVGDPMTISLEIRGSGSLERASMPPLAAGDRFKLYPPTSRIEFFDPTKIIGRKSFEQIVVPTEATITALPEIRFVFFNPAIAKYQVLVKAPVPLSVRPNPHAAVRPSGMPSRPELGLASPPASTQLVPIKPYLGTAMSRKRVPWVFQPFFLWLQLIPLGVWLSAFAYRRYRDHVVNNPRARRCRQVQKRIQRGVRDLQRLAQSHDAQRFFTTLFRLLQEQLGERLDVPASAITEDILGDPLIQRGLPPRSCVTLRALFQWCNQAKYASAGSTPELEAVIEDTRFVFKELRQLAPAPFPPLSDPNRAGPGRPPVLPASGRKEPRDHASQLGGDRRESPRQSAEGFAG